MQLETRQLDHDDIEALRVADRVEHGDTDIACRHGTKATGDQKMGGQLHRGCLAVGARDSDPLRGATALVAQAPRELDVAPDRDTASRSPGDQGVIETEPR